ncbi:hypothetical protein Fmac_031250 [Flemingia macrophylla]|uniref:PAP/OAS1 substrate-binding-related domain-containing protein n=1 Tax=Flemingia macrophylla TaxID=520843 RepID=A0ABD1L1J5_9FABA
MGDLHVNGLVFGEDRPCASSPPSPPLPPLNPDPSSVAPDAWAAAEKTTAEILRRIQPTLAADRRRREVVDYVQRLIRYGARCEVMFSTLVISIVVVGFGFVSVFFLMIEFCLNDLGVLVRFIGFVLNGFDDCEGLGGEFGVVCVDVTVFPYGSVPLKTYLPDGDIDLTALSSQNIEDGLVSDVRAVLHGEEVNEASEYEVKDVRFIDAEVKLVKCIVQDIVVDISFNQLGGLSTLCFLEKIDRLVAKDHLFKRSIILIKAWCYYESRVLGAHHGLISTYALETLVLYIFHQFHVSLDGPLAVLYRFLDYFSKFDWDNYCVSLKGPVSKSSLPNIVAEVPENGGNTLLTEEFIRSCVESFSVPSRGSDLNLRAFPQKHLNIIDPLKENNNLGRSYVPENHHLWLCFVVSSSYHECGIRVVYLLECGFRVVKLLELLGKHFMAVLFARNYVAIVICLGGECRVVGNSSLKSQQHNFHVGNFFRIRSAFKYGARKLGWILVLPENRIADDLIRFFANTLERHGNTKGNVDKSFLSLSTAFKKDWKPGNQHNYESRDKRERYIVHDVHSLAGEFFDSSANAVAGFKLGEDSKGVATSGVLDTATTNGLSNCSNGQLENSVSSSEADLNSVIDDEKEKQGMVSSSPRSHTDEKNVASCGSSVLTDANVLENNFFHSDRYATSVSVGNEATKSLLDLAGDYDSHIGNLQYGQMCNGYAVSPIVVPSPPRSPKFPNRNPWETVRQCVQINHSIRSQTNSNCVMGQQVYVINPTLPMTSFGAEEKRKVRGTGAYFPNMSSRPYRDNRSVLGRGRGQAPGTHGHLQRHNRSNGLAPPPPEMNLSAESTFEHAVEGYPALGSTKTRSSETYFPQASWGPHYANGFLHSSERHESGSVSPQLHVAPRTEMSNYPDSSISTSRGIVSNTVAVTEERSNSSSVADSKSSVFGGVRGHSNSLDDAPEKHEW